MALTFDEMQAGADERGLIRKIQKAVAFLAPLSVALPTTLFSGAGDLVVLNTAGFLPIGMVTPDGWKFGREIEKEDIDALGYASPVRSDVTKVTRSVTATLLESGRRHIQELKYGTQLTATTQDATTGEIVFTEPDLPIGEEYRLIVVGADGPADKLWIMGRGYGLVKLASTGEETWGQSGAVQSEITLDVFTDDEVGGPVRHYVGGSGALAAKTELGFDAVAPGGGG